LCFGGPGSPVYSTVRPAGQFSSPAVYCGNLGPSDELELVAEPPYLGMVEGW
jgi:hypothetical protein